MAKTEDVLVAMMQHMSLQTDVLLTILERVDHVQQGLENQAKTAAHLIAANKKRLKVMRELEERMKKDATEKDKLD